jgi:hypothetical protein
MEVDGANALELLFASRLGRGARVRFPPQIGQTDPPALPVAIEDQGGFHQLGTDARAPAHSAPATVVVQQQRTRSLGAGRRSGERTICNRLYANLR